MNKKIMLHIFTSIIIGAEICLAQGIISFESIPGGIPSDGLVISNQFQNTHGVSFVLGDSEKS